MENNKRVLGELILHYGGEYLDCAIRSAARYCEEIIVLYTSKPSHGHGTNISCPESESDLMNIAYSASNKVKWVNVDAGQEGVHRGKIFKIAEDGKYDGILVFDADEVFGDIDEQIEQCWQSTKRNIGFSRYINFWKSFNHACYDSFTPIRFHNLHNRDCEGWDVVDGTVYHFGCAQRMEIMRYKLLIHGHKSEIRPNWLTDVYERWQPGMEIPLGLHLVSHNLWPQATDFDKTQLPEILRQHFNYPKDVIF
jgi:hypothetical protein